MGPLETDLYRPYHRRLAAAPIVLVVVLCLASFWLGWHYGAQHVARLFIRAMPLIRK